MKNNPTNLVTTQAWMQAALMKPLTTEITNLVTHYISPAKELTSMQSLAIYQRSYYSRLIVCMQGQFKALLYTLGDELFEDFCKMYLKKTPSNSPNLGDLGKQFPDFLKQNRPDKEAPALWIDFMIAMAKFEVDLYKVFDVKGSEGAVFADIHTNDSLLYLQKSISLQEYPFDVNTYYKKVSEDENPDITTACKTYIIFIRTDYQVYIFPLNKIQFYLLKNIQEKKNIAEALRETTTTFNLKFEKLFADWKIWKQHWISKGFFLKNLN